MKKLIPLLLLFSICAYAQNQIFPVGGVVTINCSGGTNSVKVIVTATVSSVVFANPTAGQIVTVLFQQDATGHTVTFSGNVAGTPTVSSTANAATVLTFQYDASANTWNQVDGGSVSLPTTLSAPGVFTDTQMNTSFVISINTCDPGNVFTNVIAPNGHFGTDALSGCVSTPTSGMSNAFASGVSGYGIANQGGTCSIGTNCGAVGIDGLGWSKVAGAWAWGGNFVSQSTTGQATQLFGAEIDVVRKNTGDTGAGLLVSSFSSIQSTDQHVAGVKITNSGTATDGFDEGMDCEIGATRFSICLLARAIAAGNSQNSQTVEFDGSGSAGAVTAAALQEIPVGATSGVLKLFGGGGAAFQLPTYTVSTLPSSLPSGSMAIVTDASTFTVGTCAGGGSDMMVATFNGTTWTCH